MKIALILEGSYPYIYGGVSSWAHQLVTALSEIEFSIISIMPSSKEQYAMKYKLPGNVSNLHTVYLEDFMKLNPIQKPMDRRIPFYLKQEVSKLLSFEDNVNWKTTLQFFGDRKKSQDAVAFLKSKIFWEHLVAQYRSENQSDDFNKFFWSLISMYLPFLNILQTDLPEADIYHTISTGYAGLLGLSCKAKYNKPLLITEHGIYTREREEEIIKSKWMDSEYKKLWMRYFNFIALGVYNNAERIISLFGKARDIQVELGADPSKTLVIPNGVNAKNFDLEQKDNTGLIVASVLRIVPIKDVKTLLRAFRIVNTDIPETKLLLIGPYEEDLSYYQECKALAKLLDISDKVSFLGLQNIKDYLPNIDVLVLTSISEGQPLSMLEGMAAGIPMVATDVGSCRELLEGADGDEYGSAGIITQPVSPQETANAILTILRDKDLRMHMGIAGRKRVENYYTMENLFGSYRKLYIEVYNNFSEQKSLNIFTNKRSLRKRGKYGGYRNNPSGAIHERNLLQ